MPKRILAGRGRRIAGSAGKIARQLTAKPALNHPHPRAVIGPFNTFVSAVKQYSQQREIRSRFLKFSATVKLTTNSVNALTVILDLETKPGG
jgi:hypothetical protein